jgi:hypothetical protein
MPNTSTSFELDQNVIFNIRTNLEMYIQMLDNELSEGFSHNCQSGRLTDEQKALLPLYCKLTTALATSESADLLEEAAMER